MVFVFLFCAIHSGVYASFIWIGTDDERKTALCELRVRRGKCKIITNHHMIGDGIKHVVAVPRSFRFNLLIPLAYNRPIHTQHISFDCHLYCLFYYTLRGETLCTLLCA